jgi:ABC-type antimicrobial peptide transport system permease subunit
MIKNYFKIAGRTLQRYKAYTAINIVGLTLGVAAAILIFTILSYQLSFDTFHPNKNRIYRIVTEWHDQRTDYNPAVPQPLGKAFRSDYTFAEATARVVSYRNMLITRSLIAAPIGWWATHPYLQSFQYRVHVGPAIFLAAISFTFVIAALTAGYRSTRAALANPVKSLRTE